MGLPRLLAENFLSPVQFPSHEVVASSEVDGHEGFRIGTARRTPRNHWTPTADNALAWVQAELGAARTADTVVIDRGHNLGGHTVSIRHSNNGTDWTIARELVIPTSITPESPVAGPALTEEGAVIATWPAVSAWFWRLEINAMGPGIRPRVVGLYIGESWQPTEQFGLPWGWGDRELLYDEEVSDTAWVAATPPASRRRKDVLIQTESLAEYDLFRRHIERGYLQMRPMWIVWDQDFAERSWLAVPPPGRVQIGRESGWGYPQAVVPAVEHEPLPL